MGIIHVKQAKATEVDIAAAVKLLSILDAIQQGFYPSLLKEDPDDEEDEPHNFDPDDPDHAKRFVEVVSGLARDHLPGLNRVVWGMSTLLDSENNVVDPNSDVLEFHPDIVRAVESTRWIPVSERMPEPTRRGVPALIANDRGEVMEAKYVQPEPGRRPMRPRWECRGQVYRLAEITHWMPLPSAPGDAKP